MSRQGCRPSLARVWLVYAAVAFAGCAQSTPKPVDFSDVTRHYQPSDYVAVYQNWTRHAKLVEIDVGTVIEAWATYKSWDYRQAYLSKYASIYDLSDSDRVTLMHAQQEAGRASYDFHVAIQTTDYRWNDIERKNSPWRVTLLDGAGAELAPTSIQAVKLPELYESEFFPSRTEFTRSYEISFSRSGNGPPPAGRLILRFACPTGRIDLVWESK